MSNHFNDGGALGCWIETLKFFRMVKPMIELLENLLVLFPVREVLSLILKITDFEMIILLLNLASFRANQIVLIKLTRATVIRVLH